MSARRIFVDSSALVSVTFSPDANVLEVEFRNGLVYEYLGVSSNLFEQLLDAPSKGAFLVRHIRDRFPHRRLDHAAN